jgi:hypothetical protein
MPEPRPLSREAFAAIAAHSGLTLDRETLEEFLSVYNEHLVPILARLRRRAPLESEIQPAPPGVS